ncbi:MAG: hypothetical protein ACI96M_000479 [Candidatus Azotimanducaceae bacterium]|jgi:hypothetical protein
MDHQAFAQLLGNYGEFVGAIAVVGTLVYLAIQIRQNSAQLRIASFQTSTERYADLIGNVFDEPENFRWFRDGLASYESLIPENQARFHIHLHRTLLSYRNNLVLREAGAISDEILIEQKLDIARILKCPGAQEWAQSLVFEVEVRPGADALINDILSSGSDLNPLTVVLPFLSSEREATP